MVDLKERARRERIRILLRTRNDVYPSPRAKATPYTTSGPGRDKDLKKKKCPVCQGSGKVRIWQVCSTCDGQGKFAVDGYVGRVSDDKRTIQRHVTPEAVDAEISRLQFSLTISAGVTDPNEAYGWEKAKAQRDSQGSYRELQHALERLRDSNYLGWEFLCSIYSRGLEVEMSRKSQEYEAEIVGQLSQWMPAKIKLPYRLHEELMDDKRRRVRELLRCGESLEEIAQRVLLSVRTLEKFA